MLQVQCVLPWRQPRVQRGLATRCTVDADRRAGRRTVEMDGSATRTGQSRRVWLSEDHLARRQATAGQDPAGQGGESDTAQQRQHDAHVLVAPGRCGAASRAASRPRTRRVAGEVNGDETIESEHWAEGLPNERP